ncbi:expressed unknown protein [Seminavis robusta]|uniref:Uncharacterized protein n=1 Tax=Seminavis robusta TaxID=568900 RepID=A0A9N8D5Z3_9STRA|nr:expressed unknown protein [Seminavis robusta]|eukprot:Sro13_g009900.1 n/a (650) ;mRNA; r:60219-62168
MVQMLKLHSQRNGSKKKGLRSDASEIELKPLTDATPSQTPVTSPTNASSDENIQISKRSFTRYIVLFVAVMVGCYHLGRWTCMVEHQDLLDGDVESKPKGDDKTTKTDGDYFMNMQKVQAIRRKGQQLLSELEEYYSKHKGGAQSILIGPGGWANGWVFFGKRTAREEKLVDTMARALLNPHQSVFKIGVIGSSVAAGHDNCAYDNYQHQLERTFSPIWEAAGMKLEIQNAGQGGSCGDSHKNQVWCIQQNVSPDSDIVHYSWSYFEVGDDMDGRKEREKLVRWTQLLPNSPPVHLVNVLFEEACLGQQEGGNPHENEMFEAYQEYGYNAFCMRYAIASGQYQWKRGDPIFEGQHSGDGLHNTTRYGLNETNAERRESLGVILRNWHPGPLGFQYISDALAYSYTTAMLAALDRIEAVMATKKFAKSKTKPIVPRNHTVAEAAWWRDRPIIMGQQMKDPLFCDPRYCKVDQAPKCLNLEIPTYGFWGASIAKPNDDLNPFKGENQDWKEYQEGMGDRWHMVNRLEASLYVDKPEMCQFPDHCAAVEAKSPENGRMVFKLPKMEVGMVIICFCCGKDVAKPQFLDNPNVEVDFNGKILDRSTWDIFPEKKCARVIKEHGTAVGSHGHSYLSVRLLQGNNQTVRISHVITI